MHRLLRIVPLAACVAALACVIPNPNFDVDSGGATSTSGPQGSTSESSGTPTTSAASTTGATTTGGVGGDDSSTSGAPSTTTGADTTTDATTGAPQPMTAELRHYTDEDQCDFPFWCVMGMDVNNPSTGENRNVECFDAPFPPPFTVDRVGFVVFASKGGPGAKLEFHTYDEGAQKPTAEPFHAVDIGVVDGKGRRDFMLDPPVVVDAQRFCINVHSGEKFGPQLGLALDHVPAPAGQTFVGIDGPNGCEVPAFTDLVTLEASK
ncbi:MAG TPA: hypothetical protein VGB85_26915, partial [Nannocystis sp.]